MTIKERQQEMVESFEFFEDWTERYEYIIELGKELPLIGSDKKTEEFIIKGCQSQVWIDANFDGKVLNFTADSDAIVTSGIVSLLLKIYNGHTPQEILDSNLDFLSDLGLNEHLSMTRSNGLISMIDKIMEFAKLKVK